MKIKTLPRKLELFKYAELGFFFKAKEILDANEEYLSAHNEYGQNFMHIAAVNNNFEFIKLVLSHYNYDITCEDKNKKNIASIAANNGYKQILEILIENNNITSKNLVNSLKMTLLHFAALGGRLEIAEYLISLNPELDVCIEDIFSQTVLHYSIKAEDKENRLFFYLQRYAKKLPPTILHSAAQANNKELLDYFIRERGIDVNTQDSKGNTALYIAIKNGNIELAVSLINEYRADGAIYKHNGCYINSSLHLAAKLGNLELIKLILNGKEYPDIAAILNSNGETILYDAINSDNTVVINYLLNQYPNIVKINDKYDTSPLHLAASKISREVIDGLLKAGINPNIINAFGFTALDYAILAAQGARLLKNTNNENKANVIAALLLKQDGIENSFLSEQLPIILINYGNLTLIKAFFDRGFNKINIIKEDLLYEACKDGNIEIIKLLIIEGVKILKNDYLSVVPPVIIDEVAKLLFLAQVADSIYNIKLEAQFEFMNLYHNIIIRLDTLAQAVICGRIKNTLLKAGLPQEYERLENYKSDFDQLLTEFVKYPDLRQNMEAISDILEGSLKIQTTNTNVLEDLTKLNFPIKYKEFISFTEQNINNKKIIELIKRCMSDLYSTITDKEVYELVKKVIKKFPELGNPTQFNAWILKEELLNNFSVSDLGIVNNNIEVLGKSDEE